MKVTEVAPAYYHVAHKGRWWTLTFRHGHWLICNESGRRISENGSVGAVLVRAVTKHQEAA